MRRLWYFIRDYCDEFGCAWSVARHNDCERTGGHRYGELRDDGVLGQVRSCGRCGCSLLMGDQNV